MSFDLKQFFQKQKVQVFLGLLFVLFFSGISGAAAQEMSAEKIDSFMVDLKIEKDATLFVVETIYYDFGTNEKHGIYRDIPVEYKTKLGNNQSLSVHVESVTNETGIAYTYETSTDGGYLRVKIGDKGMLVYGKHTYVIRYRVKDAFGYFESFDELYWNITGNRWPVPIESANVVLHLPGNFSQDIIKTSCYQGSFGSNQSCDGTGNFSGDTYSAHATAPLGIGEGVTVAVGFPKGVIIEPTKSDRVISFIKDNPISLLPIIVFVAMFTLWYRNGRDPKGRGVIIPEYDVPDNLSILEIAGLIHNHISAKEISAAIIDLAVHGYINIEKKTEKILFFDNDDYVFHRLEKQPVKGSLEAMLLKALFSKDEYNDDVKLSQLKNKFYTHVSLIETAVLDSLVSKKYLIQNPKKLLGRYIGAGAAAPVLIVVFGRIYGVIGVFSVAFSATIYFIFSWLMPRVTQSGALLKEQILGLKEYLQIAEKNRIEFHNAPAKSPELFEKLLPAAMVLGVTAIWAKEFADISMEPPQWYSGPVGTHFSVVSFSSDLNSFSTATTSSLASAPGGSSGSGGGGFSGGGGGGGGGGSW
jgi:uncharacterized membrane protein YgcG